MRIVVFSDTHGDIRGCIRVMRTLIGVDMIIHAGDSAKDAEELIAMFPEIPVKYVRGNCDLSLAPAEIIVEAAGKRIYVVHGHLHNVKYDYEYETLRRAVEEHECDAGVFGHTHMGYNSNFGKYSLLNPGSMRYSGSYGVIEIDNGILKTAII